MITSEGWGIVTKINCCKSHWGAKCVDSITHWSLLSRVEESVGGILHILHVDGTKYSALSEKSTTCLHCGVVLFCAALVLGRARRPLRVCGRHEQAGPRTLRVGKKID